MLGRPYCMYKYLYHIVHSTSVHVDILSCFIVSLLDVPRVILIFLCCWFTILVFTTSFYSVNKMTVKWPGLSLTHIKLIKVLGGDANTACWPQTPFSGAWDGQNLISWRWSLPLSANPVWWGSMHAISSYHGNRPKKHSHKSAHRQDGLQYTAPQLARSVMKQSTWLRTDVEIWRLVALCICRACRRK